MKLITGLNNYWHHRYQIALTNRFLKALATYNHKIDADAIRCLEVASGLRWSTIKQLWSVPRATESGFIIPPAKTVQFISEYGSIEFYDLTWNGIELTENTIRLDMLSKSYLSLFDARGQTLVKAFKAAYEVSIPMDFHVANRICPDFGDLMISTAEEYKLEYETMRRTAVMTPARAQKHKHFMPLSGGFRDLIVAGKLGVVDRNHKMPDGSIRILGVSR